MGEILARITRSFLARNRLLQPLAESALAGFRAAQCASKDRSLAMAICGRTMHHQTPSCAPAALRATNIGSNTTRSKPCHTPQQRLHHNSTVCRRNSAPGLCARGAPWPFHAPMSMPTSSSLSADGKATQSFAVSTLKLFRSSPTLPARWWPTGDFNCSRAATHHPLCNPCCKPAIIWCRNNPFTLPSKLSNPPFPPFLGHWRDACHGAAGMGHWAPANSSLPTEHAVHISTPA